MKSKSKIGCGMWLLSKGDMGRALQYGSSIAAMSSPLPDDVILTSVFRGVPSGGEEAWPSKRLSMSESDGGGSRVSHSSYGKPSEEEVLPGDSAASNHCSPITKSGNCAGT